MSQNDDGLHPNGLFTSPDQFARRGVPELYNTLSANCRQDIAIRRNGLAVDAKEVIHWASFDGTAETDIKNGDMAIW